MPRVPLIGLFVLAVIYTLYLAQAVLVPVLIALLIAAIDRLRERGGKTLKVLPRPEPDELERLAVRTEVFDPEHPEKPWRLLKKRLKSWLHGTVVEPLA